MNALVVYCHPREESFTSAVRDLVTQKLYECGADVRLIDLYANRFDPCLSATEHQTYLEVPENRALVEDDAANVEWCDTLIFVYPTWWYGLPAALKGWLDRVFLPELAFLMPDENNKTIRPGLRHITRLGVFTTCGASWWLTQIIGAPGKRTLMRGVGFLCAKNRKTAFAAHYLMDSSTDASRRAHLDRVAKSMDRLLS